MKLGHQSIVWYNTWKIHVWWPATVSEFVSLGYVRYQKKKKEGRDSVIPTMLDAYCMWNRVSTTVDMERLSADYIRFVQMNQDQKSDSSSAFQDLHHEQCARSLLSMAFTRSGLAYSACNVAESTYKSNNICLFSKLSTIILADMAAACRNAITTRTQILWSA